MSIRLEVKWSGEFWQDKKCEMDNIFERLMVDKGGCGTGGWWWGGAKAGCSAIKAEF